MPSKSQAKTDGSASQGGEKSFWSKPEHWFWFVIITIETQPLPSILFAGSHGYDWLSEFVGAASLVYLLAPARGKIHYLKLIWPFWAYLAYCAMDSLLNPDPLLSLKTLGVFTLTAAPALVMGLRLRPIDLCRVAALVLIVGCALSAVVSLALPSVGTMPSGTEAGVYQIGGWKGLYTHKNHLGHIAGLTFGAMLLTGRGLFKDIRWWIVGLAAAAICMFGAKSSTAYVLAAALPVFYFAVAKPRGVLRYFSIFFSCLVFFTLLLFRDDIVHFALGLLGRNSSLSGRTDIWLHAGEMIMQRPVFGGGFGFSASDSYHEAITARFGVAYTHNEYLDLLLNIGAVGLILNLSLLGYAAWQSWRRRPSESTAMARNFLTLLLFGVVISGWSEGHGVEVTQVMMLSLFGLFGVAMGEARAARQSRPSRARSRSADLTAQAPQAT